MFINDSLYFFESFINYKGIKHFISTRYGGVSSPPYFSLNLAFHVGDDIKNVLKNREILASKLNTSLNSFIFAKQVHGNNVTIIKERINEIEDTDAMITNIPNIYLTILVADCVPILLFDCEKKVIGAVHAGWRGTSLFIAKKSVQLFKETFDSSSNNIIAGIGPSIGPCCYEVGEEVISSFKESIFYKEGKTYLNLWEENKKQLIEAGILEKNIEVAKVCTKCNSQIFFSRRKKNQETGRFAVGISLC